MSLFNEDNIQIQYPVHFRCANSIERYEENGDYIRVADVEKQTEIDANGYINESKMDFNFIIFGNNREEKEKRDFFLKQKLKISDKISEIEFLKELNKVIIKYQQFTKQICYEEQHKQQDSGDSWLTHNERGTNKDPF